MVEGNAAAHLVPLIALQHIANLERVAQRVALGPQIALQTTAHFGILLRVAQLLDGPLVHAPVLRQFALGRHHAVVVLGVAVAAKHAVQDKRIRLVARVDGPIIIRQREALETPAEHADLRLHLPHIVAVVEEKGAAAVDLSVLLVRVDQDLVLARGANLLHTLDVQHQFLAGQLVDGSADTLAGFFEVRIGCGERGQQA